MRRRSENSRENKKYIRELIIMALLVAIIGLTVSYAAVNTTLDIVGFTTTRVATWDVRFSSAKVVSKTEGASIIYPPRTDGLFVYYEVYLDEPGDSVTIEAVVKNNGNLNAKLISYDIFGVPTRYKDNVSYKITDKNGNTLEKNTILKGGKATEEERLMPIYITITYDEYIYEGEGYKTFNLGLGLNFMQDCSRCNRNLS